MTNPRPAPVPTGMGASEEMAMATHDMEKAEAMYSGFMSTLKWSVPVIALSVLFVVMLIAE
mgnify:CR=1 FL=1